MSRRPRMSHDAACNAPRMQPSIIELFDALQGALHQDGDYRRIRKEFPLNELEVIENQLATLSSTVGSLRNAHSPINKLPCETLAYIFSMLSQSPTQYAFIPELDSITEPYAWLVVSHVCRQWRSTAFAFPSLWSLIDGSHPNAARACLVRSVQTPLQVYLHDKVLRSRIKSTLHEDLIADLAPHSARFTELHLQPTFGYDIALLQKLCYPAPQLRALSLCLDLTARDALPVLFAGEVPRLERLVMSGFTSWPGSSFTNLTHLLLYNQVGLRPRMEDFVDMLATCPRLEELWLHDAGPVAVDAPTDEESFPRIAPLPALRRLSLGMWASAELVVCFLSHLAVPKHARIEIWGHSVVYDSPSISALFPHDTSLLEPLHELNTVIIRAVNSTVVQQVCVEGGTLKIHSRFDCPTSIFPCLNSLDLRRVERLDIDGRLAAPTAAEPALAAWRDLFSSMPQLANLSVTGVRSTEMLRALSAEGQSGGEQPLCPKLKDLSIAEDTELSTAYLCAFSEARAEQSSSLESLAIYSGACSRHWRTSSCSSSTPAIHEYEGQPDFVGGIEDDQWTRERIMGKYYRRA